MSRFALALALSAAVGIVSLGNLAHADKIKDITCVQFLAMDANAQNNIVYWVEGADVASSKKSVSAADVEVGYDAFGRPVAEVVTACKADKKASLWSKIKAEYNYYVVHPSDFGPRHLFSLKITPVIPSLIKKALF
jgi:hypothetical protein